MVPSTPLASAPSAPTCAPGPPQCAEVKPIRLPRLSLPIAVSVHNVSPLTTSPEPPPLGTGSSAFDTGDIGPIFFFNDTATTENRASQRCPVFKNPSPIDVPDPPARL